MSSELAQHLAIVSGTGPDDEPYTRDLLAANLTRMATARGHQADFGDICMARLALAMSFIANAAQEKPLENQNSGLLFRFLIVEMVRTLRYAPFAFTHVCFFQDHCGKYARNNSVFQGWYSQFCDKRSRVEAGNDTWQPELVVKLLSGGPPDGVQFKPFADAEYLAPGAHWWVAYGA